jgi:ferredoxin
VLALEDNNIHILHHYRGKAKCTTYRVEISSGEYLEITDTEKTAFANMEGDYQIMEDCLRLSCQIHVVGDITVHPIMTIENYGLDAGPRPTD